MRKDLAPLLEDGDMSGDLFSDGIDLNQQMMYAIQAVWTGSPVGELKLQVSTDIVAATSSHIQPSSINQSGNVINWSDYINSPTSVNGPGNFLWNATNSGYRWVRCVYTRTSGTGSLSITFCGKGV